MELYDVQMGFELGSIKGAIIEPISSGFGWVILLRDQQDHLTPLTFRGKNRIFEDLYVATSFAHCIGSRQISVLDSFV